MKLTFHNEKRKINDLIPYDKNPRKLTEHQFKMLTESIEKFDLAEVPVVDTDNKIVAGHQRLNVMKKLGRGDEEIDVRVPNRKLTQEEFDEYLIRSNKNTGQWDFEILANQFELNDLTAWGFDKMELGINESKMEIEVDNYNSKLDTYLGNNIRQIMLYFENEEYEKLIPRLDEVTKQLGLDNYSELLLKLLEHYENNPPENPAD